METKPRNFANDDAWARRFIPAATRILAPYMIVEAPADLDQFQATDLIIFRARDYRIAFRMRSFGYAGKYPHQFTIRCHRNSGAKTEFAKIVQDEFGDLLLYGHEAAPGSLAINPWMLIDLNAFRIHHGSGHAKAITCDNHDGTYFYAYTVTDFPRLPSILAAASYTPFGQILRFQHRAS